MNTAMQRIQCRLCKGRHDLAHCKKFRVRSLNSRLRLVRSLRCCSNCLSAKHIMVECRLPPRCQYCDSKHHSMLHRNNVVRTTNPNTHLSERDNGILSADIGAPFSVENEDDIEQSSISSNLNEATNHGTQQIVRNNSLTGSLANARHRRRSNNRYRFLSMVIREMRSPVMVVEPIAVVKIMSKGHTYNVRTLVDENREISLISSGAVRRCRLEPTRSGLVDTCVMTVQSRMDDHDTLIISARVERGLDIKAPSRSINTNWFDSRGADLILGRAIYDRNLIPFVFPGPGQPADQPSNLGYILSDWYDM